MTKAKYWTKHDPTEDGWYVVQMPFGEGTGINEWRDGRWLLEGEVVMRTVECYPDEASVEQLFKLPN